MKIGAIILAAGSSRRFGEDKRKSLLGSGKSILATTIGNTVDFFADIMVVLRFGDLEYARALEGEFSTITCYCAPDSAQGMAHSLANAIARSSNWDAAAIFLGDMPYLQTETIGLLLETYGNAAASEPIIVPVHEGSPGHPVIFSRRFFPEITRLKGDAGARSVVQAHIRQVIEVPTEDSGIERDIDRPEEIE